jgi:Predicted hydrolases or acyltransferases (alpha/beta hydrolase superfamily)
MKVNIEDEIVMDLPAVPPYCDELDLDARYVNIGDCNLYIEEEGEGVPMVILHGGPGSTHHDFHPHFSRAKNFAKVIYYDQRGCGFSDYEPGEGGYSVEQAVNDLEKLRQALGIEKWIVLGHSYGGYLAQRYAIEYPESVMGLILVTAMPGLRDTVGLEGVVHKLEPTRQYDYISEEEMKRMKEIRAEISNLVKEEKIPPEKAVEIWLYNNQLNGDWKRQNFYRPTEEEMTRSALYGWKHDGVFNEFFLGRPGFNWIMSMDAGKVDLEGAFEDCPMPTLIIEADWDLTWNTDKPQKMQENHPGSEMVVFQSSGHSPFADDPEKFFNLLEEFVTTLPEISQKDVLKWKGYLGRWEEEKKKILSCSAR